MGAARLPDPVAGGSDRRPRALPQALHGEPSKGRRKRSDRAFPAAGPSRKHPALRGARAHRGNRRNACAGPRKAQLRVVTLAPDGALLLRTPRALARRVGSTAEKDALHVQAAFSPRRRKGLALTSACKRREQPVRAPPFAPRAACQGEPRGRPGGTMWRQTVSGSRQAGDERHERRSLPCGLSPSANSRDSAPRTVDKVHFIAGTHRKSKRNKARTGQRLWMGGPVSACP